MIWFWVSQAVSFLAGVISQSLRITFGVFSFAVLVLGLVSRALSVLVLYLTSLMNRLRFHLGHYSIATL
jgi:hypothetical protein